MQTVLVAPESRAKEDAMATKPEKAIGIVRTACLTAAFGGIPPLHSAHAPKMA
jgi:hypothetical protein